MADEAAVLDVPVETGADDIGTSDTSTDTSTNSDTGTTDAIDSADTPQSGETGHLRGAELYRAVKDKLKASGLTPAEQRSLRNAIHIAAKADEATGGDLNRFTAEREAYQQLVREGEESLPTEELIQTVRADRDQLAGIIADIQAGAPRLLQEMVEDNPESFKSLVPQAMDRLAELDNDRFSNYIARSAVSFMNAQGIPVEFAVLDEFLPSIPDFPGKARVIQALQKVYKAFNSLETLASKQIPTTAKTAGENGADANQNNADAGLVDRIEAWNSRAGKPNEELNVSEMNRAASARKVTLTDAEKKQIRASVAEEFNSRLASNRQYGQTMQGYLKSGNRREYEKRAAAEGQKLLPSIVARHTNAAIDKRTAAGATKTSTGTTKTTTPSQPVKDGSGNLIQWISGPPKSVGLQVDHNRQRPGMMARGEAYIVGQKAVHHWKVKTAMMA
jgi:hypothetical protein